ncbi:MAG: inositol-3-phosphate synthase [Myxococcales bacterium]|nr:inositol-3-phosphate synthase [Myxococcales bacterium]MDH3844750.1 inositol-3-phosphate synthase [Myxococcales bacterium]
MTQPKLKPATGKLGVLLPGMGAVGTTFIAGALLARNGAARPIGSLTQMDTLRLGKRTEARSPMIRDFVPIANVADLVFGGWDLFRDNAYEAAVKAEVLATDHLNAVKDELSAIKPMESVFFPEFVKRLRGENVKPSEDKMELAEAVREDIRRFKKENGLDRCVAVWCGSTEVHREPTEVHSSLSKFEEGLRRSDPAISPSQVYAYACLREEVSYSNGAPNLTAGGVPAILELSRETSTPVSGKDFKTGQTLMKTVLAPGLRARMLGIRGWFSTNILGNRDGEVLDDPDSFKSKEVSKLGVLETILQPELHPELYQDMYHKVRIEYYPPRGDQKEGWDNIDIFGWLGYPMQIKVDFLCRDSILAAPLVLDLALFMDLAHRAGLSGIQEWLSFYYKSPITPEGLYPENNLFVQLGKLKNTLRWMQGEELITYLGREYYE